MDTLTHLQQNRRIIHDLTLSTLAPIPTTFGRLAYLASLRDLSTNLYDHPGLSAYYPSDAVRQALEQCHEELFERILETPLTLQEEDLRQHLSSTPGGLRTAVVNWLRLEAYRTLLPAESPDYLKELFCSNVRAILEILAAEFAANEPLG
jgi:hypothetical protein